MKRVIFYCGPTIDEWAPPKLNDGGIGGSETAVVHVAKHFADAGWAVDVFTRVGKWEGVHDGVGYWEFSRLPVKAEADVFVSWRHPEMHTAPVQAKKRILWLHDHNYGPGAGPDLTKWETVLGVSRYHADWLTEAYELVRPADFVPNGIDLARFPADVPKVFGRCVYASSPDRGLIDLLQMWPAIAKVDPKAELHVAYGWNTFDRLIASGRQDIAEQKAAIEKVLAKTPQVVMRGRLGQNDLAMLYSESVAMLYPTSFLETSCIGVMEACAGGCVPIVSTAGALKETAREGGIIVSGPNGTPSSPWSTAWRDFFVHVAQGVLFDSVVRRHGEQRARAAAPSFAWARSFEKWDEVVAA